MRIRKNLKLSSTSSSSSEDATFQAHVCQLNQSPWDLIPFDSHSYCQFEYDDSSFTAAAAVNGDSIGAVESVASMMDIDEQQAKLEDVAAIAMMELVDDNAKGSAKLVTTNNGGSGGGYTKKLTAAAAAAAPPRGGGSRPNGNKARAVGFKKPPTTGSSTNPYEFYYYSGFGPTWSTKRRGDRIGREANKNNNNVENLPAFQRSEDDIVVGNTTTAIIIAPPMEENVEELDYDLDLIDDEEEDDYHDDDGGGSGGYGRKKRMRKPVKARSLKSLM